MLAFHVRLCFFQNEIMKLHCFVDDLGIVEVGVAYIDVAVVAIISETADCPLSKISPYLYPSACPSSCVKLYRLSILIELDVLVICKKSS